VLNHTLLDQHLILTTERSIFWEEEKALILSDLHLGKTGHFRKSGIAVPGKVNSNDLHRLFSQIQFFKPEKLIIVGDLFHSSENKQLLLFKKWRDDHRHTDFILVRGNHDILPDSWFQQSGINIRTGKFDLGPFSFIHDRDDLESTGEKYVFSGHIHPSVMISGKGRQSLRLPCFLFRPKEAILPAFGSFTGSYTLEPTKKDSVFLITESEIIKMPAGKN